MDSFILDLESRAFSLLSRISLFGFVRWLLPKYTRTYGFVDAWVLANLAVSVASLFAIGVLRGWWGLVVLLYGALRVFETLVYLANVLLFDEYRARNAGREYRLGGYRRLVLLSLHNYAELAFWFAVAYRQFHEQFAYEGALRLQSSVGAFYFSLVTLATVGYGDIRPKTALGGILVISEIAAGVFMALVILARFISHLPKPQSHDRAEPAD